MLERRWDGLLELEALEFRQDDGKRVAALDVVSIPV